MKARKLFCIKQFELQKIFHTQMQIKRFLLTILLCKGDVMHHTMEMTHSLLSQSAPILARTITIGASNTSAASIFIPGTSNTSISILCISNGLEISSIGVLMLFMELNKTVCRH